MRLYSIFRAILEQTTGPARISGVQPPCRAVAHKPAFELERARGSG
jgi:hypothetical protein